MLTEITGKPVEPGELTAPPEEPRSSVRELLADRLRSRTTTTALIWIALNISYYGLFLWLPFVLQAEKSFSINVYLLLTLSALSQFPGYAAAIWLVERIGRKPTLAVFLILGGALGVRVRGRRHPERLRDRALLRRLLQPRRLGGGLPVHVRDVPDAAALDRLRRDGRRRQDGRDRRPVHLRAT